jgi:hypothetical protein
MDTKIIAGLVGVMVVLGGVWYFFTHQSQSTVVITPPVATTTEAVATSTAPVPQPVAITHKTNVTTKAPAPKPVGLAPEAVPPTVAGVNTVSYLFGLKQSLFCNIKTSNSNKLSGTLYVANDEMRGDFTSIINGISTNTSMIDDGNYLYVWKSGTPTGLKLLSASSVSGSAIANNGGIDLATNITFACNPWIENATFFAPPSSVTFSNNQ